MKQQHGQIFHHEEAHPKKPHVMNFRCSVTMAILPETITKEDSSQMGRISSIVLLNNNKSQQNDSKHELYKLLPAKDVTAHLNQVILPRRQCARYNTPANGKKI